MYALSRTEDPTSRVDGSITQFEINADGTLSTLTPASVTAAGRPIDMRTDALGRYLYVVALPHVDSTNFPGIPLGPATLLQYRIEADGSLSALTPATIALPFNPNEVLAHPSGQFMYVKLFDADNLSNQILQFKIGPDGALSPLTPASLPVANTPRSAAIHPDGKHFYLATFVDIGEAHVFDFAIDNEGRLQGSPTPAFINESDLYTSVFIDSFGRYLYMGDTTFGANLTHFAIRDDGSLEQPVRSPGMARVVAFDPKGRYAYLAPPYTRSTIEADGRLVDLMPSLTTWPSGSLAFESSGRYAYALQNDAIKVWSLSDDGLPTALPAPTTPTQDRAFMLLTVP